MNTYGLTEYRFNKIMEMLHTIAKREGISNPKFDISKGSERGDGYCGEKTRVALKGDNKSMDLFVKGAPTDDAFKKAFDPRPIFLLEIMFYTDILPIFNDFQISKKISNPFTSLIECFDTCNDAENEVLVLQNVKSLGYEQWNKKNQMNKEHVEFVYTEYGKYHGISYALRDQKPEVYQGLLDRLPVVAMEQMGRTMPDSFNQMAELGRGLFDPVKEADLYKKYVAYLDYLPDYVQKLADQTDQYRVFIHGDCWSSNMMFKYASSDKMRPEKMCFLDFQICASHSPAMDLSYFMYSSSPKEIYDNLDHYLQVYYDSLSKTIRDLGSDPEALIPFAELKNQWKKFSRYGLMMSSIVLKICIQEEDEVMDFSDAMEASGGTEKMAGFTKKGRHDAVYNERLKSLLVHMIKNNFL